MLARYPPGAGATSPGPFSPEGDTAPDIYRKHVARIEELERENRRLAKETADSEKKWQKAEGELADLREADPEEKPKQRPSDGLWESLVRIIYPVISGFANDFLREPRSPP